MAYVEVKAKTVEMAIEAAMRELGVSDRARLDIEVLQEPERGFLGFGGQDAVVKVAEKEGKGRRRNRKRARTKNGSKAKGEGSAPQQRRERPAPSKGGNQDGNNGRNEKGERGPRRDDDRSDVDVSGQEPLVRQFLEGLLGALNLEGEVGTKVEEDVIIANVVGDQTEALVGTRGTVMEAVHELTKTVLQRSAQQPARVRIDIAGYAERRRQALTIYAGELIDQVLEEGGELMLEPMSASDRKVIHDAVAAREGVRSYSEGEAPSRYVVIAAVEEQVEAETPEG